MRNRSAPLLRSWLFAPANRPRHVAKAAASAAHGVILDLEDAVAIDEKATARSALLGFLQKTSRTNLFVRINGLATPFAADDIEAVMAVRIAGIVLPKAERARDIEILDWLMLQAERRLSLPPGSAEIMPLVETAAGLSSLPAISSASARIRRICFGAADFTADLGLTWTIEEQELLPYRSALVLVSRTAGLQAPIDTPWVHLSDQAGLAASARRARDHGFQGKLCIHPDQIDVVNSAFVPSEGELDRARRIVAEFEAAGSGVAMVGGKMVDAPLVETARRLIEESGR